jgi:hypothetical protein
VTIFTAAEQVTFDSLFPDPPRECLSDEERPCPEDRECGRPCPYRGWEAREMQIDPYLTDVGNK